MVNPRPSLRRRTLRPTNRLTLVEGVMTCTDAYDFVTLEIVGGPPYVTATVRVGGAVCHQVSLDGCGTGSVRVKAAPSNPTVEIAIEDLVLLTGHLPAAPDTDRNGA